MSRSISEYGWKSNGSLQGPLEIGRGPKQWTGFWYR